MPIKNHTTTIDVYKSLGEIQGALAGHGACKIMVDYGATQHRRIECKKHTINYSAANTKIFKGGNAMKRAMLSQPVAGKSEAEIIATRNKAITALTEQGYEIVNTLFTDEWYSKEKMLERGVVQVPLCFLAKSLENMALCHATYFCSGWENARGCRIEYEAAKAYGLEIIFEKENQND